MRFLFVSATIVGGSGRSQRELAAELIGAGHQVGFLVDDDRPARLARWWYERLSDLSVKMNGRAGGRPVVAMRDALGRRVEHRSVDQLDHLTSPIPENALAAVIASFEPDVVVGNSLERWQWRRVHQICKKAEVPTILYVREEESLGHLHTEALPDAVVANAESLAASVAGIGLACEFIPSVIDVSRTRTDSSRRVVLGINPIESRGVDVVWRVAARLPDIPFVLQESWPLSDLQLALIKQNTDALPNVELRRAVPPGPGLYGDARVVLVPYRVDNRPRVITESQANSIPVIVADVPALSEAIGPGGIAVALDDLDAWVDALTRLWHDEDYYWELSGRAGRHAARPENDPDRVAAQFTEVAERVVRLSAP